MKPNETNVRLERMTQQQGEAILSGARLPGVLVAADYPTEFSRGVAGEVGKASELGPYLIFDGDTLVGEIGGSFTHEGEVEIGYAVVRSRWGEGIATEAVKSLVSRLQAMSQVELVKAHTPLERPNSARVLEKAGFTCVGEFDDEHEGQSMRVKRWVWRG